MPDLLLNTVALEPNRWTPDKVPHFRLTDLLPDVAAAGFRRLEVWQHHLTHPADDDVAGLVETANALGVSMPIVGLYPTFHAEGAAREHAWAEVVRAVQRAQRVGARKLKVFAGSLGSDAVDAAAYDRSIGFARELVALAAEHGMSVTAETHPDTLCDSVEAACRFLADVAHPALRLCYQPFDLTSTRRAVADYEALAEHVTHLHLQGRRDDVFCLLEDADVDYRPLFAALRANGFEGELCIEFVADCVVPAPEAFDLGHVLGNAQRDRDWVADAAQTTGLEIA